MGNQHYSKQLAIVSPPNQNIQKFFKQKIYKHLQCWSYNKFSVVRKDDQDRKRFQPVIKKIMNKIKKQSKQFKGTPAQRFMADQKLFDIKELGLGVRTNRSIACLLGLAICDALGACTQFIHFQKDRRDLIQYDFNDVKTQVECELLTSRFGKIGVWTDDCSMALCIADSLLLNEFNFNPTHIRFMFHLWLFHGLDNGGRQESIGLGGNIKISMEQFCHKIAPFTSFKDGVNNGNGALMRLAPIPICFSNQEAAAMDYAAKSSRTTHDGEQSEDCCKLLALIIIRLINRKDDANWRQVITSTCQQFSKMALKTKTVKYLALSQCQTQQLFLEQSKNESFLRFNKSLEDRNWNWKSKQYTYSPTRLHKNPTYIGSYCMDALSMALHTVWHTNNFMELALWNCNMGGDCDTVGAIAGQIGGAIYGIGGYMVKLYSQMDDGMGSLEVFVKGVKLAMKNSIKVIGQGHTGNQYKAV